MTDNQTLLTNIKRKPRRFLRKPEVCHRIGLGRSKLDGMVRAGEFCRPVKLGPINVWPESEVDEWIDQQILKRDAALERT